VVGKGQRVSCLHLLLIQAPGRLHPNLVADLHDRGMKMSPRQKYTGARSQAAAFQNSVSHSHVSMRMPSMIYLK